MTEQETREKIKKVLDETIRWEPYYYIFRGIVYEGDLDNIADALIAAGIGDMSKQRLLIGKDGTVKQLYSGEEVEQIAKERDEYKHRAEVAERALLLSCADVMSDIQTIVFPKTKTQVSGKQELYDYYIKQAEREIEEERK